MGAWEVLPYAHNYFWKLGLFPVFGNFLILSSMIPLCVSGCLCSCLHCEGIQELNLPYLSVCYLLHSWASGSVSLLAYP